MPSLRQAALVSIDSYPDLIAPLIIFLLAFFISIHGTYVALHAARALGLLDRPGARKIQSKAVPCAGGVAIVVAVVLSLAAAFVLWEDLDLVDTPGVVAVLAVGCGIATVGLLDDIVSVRAVVKLAALAVGCLYLFQNGIGLNRTPFVTLNFLLTFLWIAGVSSAFNGIDNSDGVASAVCVISAFTLFLMGWSSWQISFSFLAMALAGGALGFFHHNIRPARIYMGDTGSFFLGYILAVLVIYGEWSSSPGQSFLAGCLVVAVPIYDLGLTSILRIRHGIVRTPLEVLAYSDRDHLAHRLMRMGLSHRAMLVTICLISLACCVVALVVVRVRPAVAFTLVGSLSAILCGLALHIDRRTSEPSLWVAQSTGPAASPTPLPFVISNAGLGNGEPGPGPVASTREASLHAQDPVG